ncbi:MAG: SIS domain-containing protein [Labilithrix sp.]|nr:SIS domain-containing protein [Labilithrix sp.]MCW5810326.1 SIS domain-containing protein [Labilithrix sp.]
MSTRALELLLATSVRDGVQARSALLQRCAKDILAACALVVDCLRAGNKVLFCGNGGSAADAQHLAAELVGRYVTERRALPGIALTVDTSILTAVGNDYGFERVFARQVEALGQKGDVLVAITTSGGSPNVLAAIESARARGVKVLGLTGAKGTKLAASCDACVAVPSRVTSRIQECHIMIGHVLCEAVDAAFEEHGVAAPASGAAPKVLSRDDLALLRQQTRHDKKTIVWTNGVFDVLHAGHLSSLRAARAHGDVLVVGVNADETVRAAKGEGRPIFPLAERLEMLAALELVDFVHAFAEPTPEEALGQLRPDVHCKGADYAAKPIPERAVVEAHGGKVVLLPLVPQRSTTSAIAALLAK